MAQAEAGKGSKPRKSQDLNAYSDGYDRIFGNKKKREPYRFDSSTVEQKKPDQQESK